MSTKIILVFMKKSLKKTEFKRKSLHKKLENIGDFRRETISVNYRKCGKKNCICIKKCILATAHNIYGIPLSKERAMKRM